MKLRDDDDDDTNNIAITPKPTVNTALSSLHTASSNLACFCFLHQKLHHFGCKLTLHRLPLEQRCHNNLKYRPNKKKILLNKPFYQTFCYFSTV